eukprot:ANDGO_02857.mRNA.1 hypothetical protein
MEKAKNKLLIRNAAQLVCVANSREIMKIGSEMSDVCIIEDGAVVVNELGRIEAVGLTSAVLARYSIGEFETVLDATGLSVVPGLVDAHTHPVWAGDRVSEFAMKLAGATYMDIHRAGGGIHFTVRHTREAAFEELVRLSAGRFDKMLSHGTTLVEAKSGYGLEVDTEVKMLRVLHEIKKSHQIDVAVTFLGAHSVPHDLTEQQATERVVHEMLPAINGLRKEGNLTVDMIDVFHEQGVFGTDSTREILEAGCECGLKANFHGDELHAMGSGELAGHLKECLAVSHLECISGQGISTLAMKKIVGVILPTTIFVLRLSPPPVRQMIESGVPIALGSDFNPNAHCFSMPLVMNFACVLCKMSMPEALVAATLNAAASIGRSREHGSIEVGKWGDFVIVNSPRWEHLVYQMGDVPIRAVIKKGVVVRDALKR